MGFTVWLAIVYVLLVIITAIAFAKKKKVTGIITTAIMVLGIVVLGARSDFPDFFAVVNKANTR